MKTLAIAIAIAISLFAVESAGQAAAAPPGSLDGTWQQVDVRSLEGGRQAGGGECLRIWLERRSYVLEADGESAEGIYSNHLMAIPLGMLGAGCRFAPPAEEALDFHDRTWQVQARRDGAGWAVSAHHPVSTGPLDLEAPPFNTRLRLGDSGLVDERDGDPLVFRRPSEPPAAARQVLERDLERLHTGDCVAVFRRLELRPEARSRIDEICDLNSRSRDFTGRYEGIEMQRVETFDAVPAAFPDPASTTWEDRPGVLFDYKINFERQDLYGTAIVWRKEGAWRLAYLW